MLNKDLFFTLQVWELKTLTVKTVISGLHHWVRALALSTAKVRL